MKPYASKLILVAILIVLAAFFCDLSENDQVRGAFDMDGAPQINAEDWVDRYGDALFHFAMARVKDRLMAEDLVQETFLAAVQAKAHYKGKSTEKTWLFGILKHKIVDHFRRSKTVVNTQDLIEDSGRMEAFFNADGSWQKPPHHWSTNPGKAHETKEFLDHFFSCLSGLPQRTADVFVHREIDGLSTDEICNLFNITENNCWVILYRARMLLRKCLELVGFSPYAQGNES
jgi:RNA polymerase sigma-70 factor (ECF subfamily)